MHIKVESVLLQRQWQQQAQASSAALGTAATLKAVAE